MSGRGRDSRLPVEAEQQAEMAAAAPPDALQLALEDAESTMASASEPQSSLTVDRIRAGEDESDNEDEDGPGDEDCEDEEEDDEDLGSQWGSEIRNGGEDSDASDNVVGDEEDEEAGAAEHPQMLRCYECQAESRYSGTGEQDPTCNLCGSGFVEIVSSEAGRDMDEAGREFMVRPGVSISQRRGGDGVSLRFQVLEMGNEDHLGLLEAPPYRRRPPEVHNNIVCDGCQMNPIVGPRYKCHQCADFDLCEACHATFCRRDGHRIHDTSHTFRRLSAAETYSSQAMLAEFLGRAIRQQAPETRPTSERAVQQLDKFNFEPGVSEVKEEACVICQEEYEAGQELVRLPCKHEFHKSCIVPWLGRMNTCPTCRHELEVSPTDPASTRESHRVAVRNAATMLETLFDLSMMANAESTSLPRRPLRGERTAGWGSEGLFVGPSSNRSSTFGSSSLGGGRSRRAQLTTPFSASSSDMRRERRLHGIAAELEERLEELIRLERNASLEQSARMGARTGSSRSGSSRSRREQRGEDGSSAASGGTTRRTAGRIASAMSSMGRALWQRVVSTRRDGSGSEGR